MSDNQFVFLTSRHLDALTTRAYFKSININTTGQHEIQRVGSTFEFTGIADDATFLVDPKLIKNRAAPAAAAATGAEATRPQVLQ